MTIYSYYLHKYTSNKKLIPFSANTGLLITFHFLLLLDEIESTILLTGLTDRMNKEVIETFFNGMVIDKGVVRNVQMSKVDRSAIIQFDNDKGM
jgi:hypothetical protein